MRGPHVLEPVASLAHVLASSFGPHGGWKLVRSGNGEWESIKSSAHLLQRLSVSHPVARMVLAAALQHVQQYADGGTAFVLFTHALLVQADQLLRQRSLSPHDITCGFRACCDRIAGFFSDHAYALRHDAVLHREHALALCRSVICPRVHMKPVLVEEAVLACYHGCRAALGTRAKADARGCEALLSRIPVLHVHTGRGRVTHVHGFVFPTRFVMRPTSWPGSVASVCILGPHYLVPDRTWGHSELRVHSAQQRQRVHRLALERVVQRVTRVVDAGADVVFVGADVHPMAVQLLLQHGVALVTQVPAPTMQLLCATFNAPILTAGAPNVCATPTPPLHLDPVLSRSRSELVLGGGSGTDVAVLRWDTTAAAAAAAAAAVPPVVSIVVQGSIGAGHVVSAVRAACRVVLHTWCGDGRLVAGGGFSEAQGAAACVSGVVDGSSPSDSGACVPHGFARALLHVSLRLGVNAGALEPCATEGDWMGSLVPAIRLPPKSVPCMDSLTAKLSLFRSCAELVCALVNVDQLVTGSLVAVDGARLRRRVALHDKQPPSQPNETSSTPILRVLH